MSDETERFSEKLDEVIAECIEAEEAGEPVDRDTLLTAYPDLADNLREFFADRDRLRQLAGGMKGWSRQRAFVPPRVRYFGDYANGAGYSKRYPSNIVLGVILCFEETTGKFLWQYSSEKLPTGRVHDWPLQGMPCTPVIDGDRIWFVTNRCEVVVPHQWPGGDGFTHEDMLREYPALAASRLVPGEDVLNRLHPELAAELAQFFAARDSQQGAETEGGVQTFVRPRKGGRMEAEG